MNNENVSPPVAGHKEPMIDAKEASAALRLPYYWFADQAMRAKYKIPHYIMGGLVRYRTAELIDWVQANTKSGLNAEASEVSS